MNLAFDAGLLLEVAQRCSFALNSGFGPEGTFRIDPRVVRRWVGFRPKNFLIGPILFLRAATA